MTARTGSLVCSQLSRYGEHCATAPTFRVVIEQVTRYYLCTRHANALALTIAERPTYYPTHRVERLAGE